MSKHTTHLCGSTIQRTLDDNCYLQPYRPVGPNKPAYLLNALYKKDSEKYRSRNQRF